MLKRTKRRYLALAIDSIDPVDSRQLINSIWESVTKLYGEYGASKVGLTLIDFDDDGKHAVIRCMHTALNMIRASLASITKINGNPVAVHVVVVSGTLRALYAKTGWLRHRKLI